MRRGMDADTHVLWPSARDRPDETPQGFSRLPLPSIVRKCGGYSFANRPSSKVAADPKIAPASRQRGTIEAVSLRRIEQRAIRCKQIDVAECGRLVEGCFFKKCAHPFSKSL